MVLGILTYGQDTGGLKDVQLGPPPKENAPINYRLPIHIHIGYIYIYIYIKIAHLEKI